MQLPPTTPLVPIHKDGISRINVILIGTFTQLNTPHMEPTNTSPHNGSCRQSRKSLWQSTLNTCLSLLEGSEPLLEPRGQNKVTAAGQQGQLLPQVRVLTQRQLPHPHPRFGQEEVDMYTRRTPPSTRRCPLDRPKSPGASERCEQRGIGGGASPLCPCGCPLSEREPLNARGAAATVTLSLPFQIWSGSARRRCCCCSISVPTQQAHTCAHTHTRTGPLTAGGEIRGGGVFVCGSHLVLVGWEG